MSDTTDEFLDDVEATIMDNRDDATAEKLNNGTLRIHPDNDGVMDACVLTMDSIASDYSDQDSSLRYEIEQLSGAGENEHIVYEISNVHVAPAGAPRNGTRPDEMYPGDN